MKVTCSKNMLLLVMAASSFVFGADAANKSLRNHRDLVTLFNDDETISGIIGGDEATPGRYSYAVSLQYPQYGDAHFCGGSLIAPDVVLTAAHCLDFGVFNVVIGRHDVTDKSEGVSIPMTKEIIHPDYDVTSWADNDFGIVILETPTTLPVEFVTLNKNNKVPSAGKEVTTMGWGVTDVTEPTLGSDVLKDVSLYALSNKECKKSKGTEVIDSTTYEVDYIDLITDAMLCAIDENEAFCQGDSGGPVIVKGSDSSGRDDVQVGVVSWVPTGCVHPSLPSVSARISDGYDWIAKQVCSNSKNPPASFNCKKSKARKTLKAL